MTWHGVWLYDREHQDGSSFTWHHPSNSAVITSLRWLLKERYKKLVTHWQQKSCSVESGEYHFTNAINNNNVYALRLSSSPSVYAASGSNQSSQPPYITCRSNQSPQPPCITCRSNQSPQPPCITCRSNQSPQPPCITCRSNQSPQPPCITCRSNQSSQPPYRTCRSNQSSQPPYITCRSNQSSQTPYITCPGFRPGKCTWENAAAFTYDVYEGFLRKEPAVAVAIDLKDAYNRVHFKLLTDLLIQYGVSLTLTRWVAGALQWLCSLETGALLLVSSQWVYHKDHRSRRSSFNVYTKDLARAQCGSHIGRWRVHKQNIKGLPGGSRSVSK